MDDAHKNRLEELKKAKVDGTIDENGKVELKSLEEQEKSFGKSNIKKGNETPSTR